jgi:hypothetical protein
MPTPEFRPTLPEQLSRDVAFVASAMGISPVNFVRGAVQGAVSEMRARAPELNRAMNEREEYAQALGRAFAEKVLA